MDEVEGINVPNVENWLNVFIGEALAYKVTLGLKATS